jgi:polar amino acid transport system substrate-binding protein
MNDDQLNQVLATATKSTGLLMVGFNRRFSPLAQAGKEFFEGHRGPLSIVYRVNAGRIKRDSWIQDPIEGGGRIVGEACHFVDLMQYWIGVAPVSVFAESVSGNNHESTNADSVFITMRFADGSNGCIAYLAEGDSGLAKERVEIFGEGKSFVLDDFRTASFFKNRHEQKKSLRAQDKGQAEQVKVICNAVRNGGPQPISLHELAATTRATFRAVESLRTGLPQQVEGS